MSYCCDRARSVTWGIEGGLPSFPHGVWLNRGTDDERFLGAVFSNVPRRAGRRVHPAVGRRRRLRRSARARPRRRSARTSPTATSPSSARRATTASWSREVDAELAEYEVDPEATEREREHIRAERRGWLEEDPEAVAERYRAGELDVLDLVRRHGVILDWGTGELLPRTTEQFRAMLDAQSRSPLGGR